MQNNGTKIIKPLGGHKQVPFWGKDDNRITEEGTTFFFIIIFTYLRMCEIMELKSLL